MLWVVVLVVAMGLLRKAVTVVLVVAVATDVVRAVAALVVAVLAGVVREAVPPVVVLVCSGAVASAAAVRGWWPSWDRLDGSFTHSSLELQGSIKREVEWALEWLSDPLPS